MKEHILLIDNDSIHLEIYYERLCREGYEVTCATNGIDGILSIKQRLPDLVILDINMPGMTGVEVGEQIRANERSKDVPILILTALDESYPEAKILHINADYLTKFADYEVFMSHLKRLIEHNTTYNYAFLTINIDTSIHYEIMGSSTVPGKMQTINLDRSRLNQDMNYIGKVIYDYHNKWLESRRNDDILNESNYLNARQAWRVQATGKGRDLYKTIFEQNPRLMEDWGKIQKSVEPLNERLVLRFGGPRSNLTLPFELLHNHSHPLALLHPISRKISGPTTIQPSWRSFLASKEGQMVKILLIASDEWAVEEIHIIIDKLQSALERVDVKLDYSEARTFEKTKELLEQKSFNLVHYAGHAFFDQDHPERSYISLRDQQGFSKQLNTASLFTLLSGSQVQFLYLSCCSGAEIGDESILDENTYLGLLDAAAQAGVPAILGYRWPVVGRWAKEFASHFYEGLKGYPFSLEHATWWARRQIFDTSSQGGWNDTWFSPMLVVQNPESSGGVYD